MDLNGICEKLEKNQPFDEKERKFVLMIMQRLRMMNAFKQIGMS